MWREPTKEEKERLERINLVQTFVIKCAWYGTFVGFGLISFFVFILMHRYSFIALVPAVFAVFVLIPVNRIRNKNKISNLEINDYICIGKYEKHNQKPFKTKYALNKKIKSKEYFIVYDDGESREFAVARNYIIYLSITKNSRFSVVRYKNIPRNKQIYEAFPYQLVGAVSAVYATSRRLTKWISKLSKKC